MSALTLPGLGEAVVAAVASVGALCLAVCRYLPLDEPESRPGETRHFIDASALPESSLLRVAPVLVAAETLHRANGPMPAVLGVDEPRNYWPHFVPYPARHRLTTTTEDNHR